MKQNIFKGLKSFLLLWSSQAVSALGMSMTSYALIIWTYARQGTASSVTLLSFFHVFADDSAALCDRRHRRPLE